LHDQRINKVVILGGGTAGWMTAAALAKLFSPRIKVSLVESDEIGIVGVGEATIPTIHWFNELIELKEAEFMLATQASFKLGIEFVDWTEPNHSYFHPFGQYGAALGGVPFHHRWLKARRDGLKAPISAYSLTTQLALNGRFAKPALDPKSILSTLGYAYHFDAGLYARHLRTLSEAQGVARYEGKVVRIDQDSETGFITALTTDKGDRLEGELFVDCSGFRALLIQDVLGAGYDDWSHWLPCDRAVAVPCARGDAITPFTRSTARDAGWQWRIPLRHRTGNGYVYSSAFTNDEAAAELLLANLDGEALADPRFLRFTAGRRRKAWDRNVVAIGLSAGFLEPLESTSIHLIQSGIAKLLALFPDRDCDPGLVAQFNRLFALDMDNIKDFLILHYHATSGRNEPLWEYCRHMALPATLIEKEAVYRKSGRLLVGTDDLFKEASWIAVFNGQGIHADDYYPLADMLDSNTNLAQLKHIEQVISRSLPTLPVHEQAILAVLNAGRESTASAQTAPPSVILSHNG
jgi:tryptophan halogenase